MRECDGVEAERDDVTSASRAELEFDHVWIVVTRDAPERAALGKSGIEICPM